jgi:DNA mismatch repair protein MutS2
MESHAARVLEFPRLAELVARHARTRDGQAAVRQLYPFPPSAFPELPARLSQVVQFMELVAEHGSVPLSGVQNLTAELELIRVEETYLPPQALITIAETFRWLEKIIHFAAHMDEQFSSLRILFDGLSSFRPLTELIESCFDEREEMKDSASFALAEIRRQIKSTRRKLNTILEAHLQNPAYQPIIQDHLITHRNNRYVIPVKLNFRTFFSGIIHDQSRTQMTFFVEPVETIGLNNSLGILQQEEQEEEIRILKMIAGHLRAEAGEIVKVLGRVFLLDQIQAKALYGLEIGGSAPKLLTEWTEGFFLKQARHPLLLTDKGPEMVVPVDIDFEPGIQGLVVSGANAGGKTVALKTLGLVSLMARCALPLPVAAESSIPLFGEVFADIGDEQSISEDVSTFSGHLHHIDTILRCCDTRSLVLFDELGAGTDPQEGAALAMAVMDELHERQAAFLVTTHYNNVKVYAYERPWVESVAVSFDAKSLQPLYRLQYGIPGLSNALQVARLLEFNSSVIVRARSYLDRDHDQVVVMAEKLEKRLVQVQNKELELFKLKQEAFHLREQCRKEREMLLEQQENLRQTASRQLAEIVSKAEAEFKAMLVVLEKKQQEMDAVPFVSIKTGKIRHEFAEIKRGVGKLLPTVPVRPPKSIDLNALSVGDRVTLDGSRQVAEVEAVDRHKQLVSLCMSGNLRLSMPMGKITSILSKGDIKKPVSVNVSVSSRGGSPLSTLNLIGKRVDEAREELEGYLDQAMMAGMEKVEIIHGFGTGRLRKGIHEFLRQLPYISNYYHPPADQGGQAVTVVEFKG